MYSIPTIVGNLEAIKVKIWKYSIAKFGNKLTLDLLNLEIFAIFDKYLIYRVLRRIEEHIYFTCTPWLTNYLPILEMPYPNFLFLIQYLKCLNVDA